MIDQNTIQTLLRICQQASDAILAIYNQENVNVETKADLSPITQADMDAHTIIKEGLAQLTPDIPQLSEECCDIAFKERCQWPIFWCIDPLDGTKEFIQRNGEFTINIALIQNNKPIFGMVYTPVTQTAYWGGCAYGAWKQEGDCHAVQIKSRPLGEQLNVMTSRRHLSAQQDDILKPVQDQFHLIEQACMGSSLKMCLIAEGVADFYPRLFPTSEWDTAAAQAIVEAAGGCIVAADTLSPLRYNESEAFINPSFFVCGDPLFPLEVIAQGLDIEPRS